MTRLRGFTLLELMIVIVIIVLLSTLSVALLSVFFRGQAVRQGAMVLAQAVAACRQNAAQTHRTHFLVLSNDGLRIHEDTLHSGAYAADGDHPQRGETIELPKFVRFEYAPAWVGLSPSGHMSFSPGFPPMKASAFDSIMNGPKPAAIGDVVLGIEGQPYKMCVNFERASGKVRRSFFLNQEAP